MMNLRLLSKTSAFMGIALWPAQLIAANQVSTPTDTDMSEEAIKLSSGDMFGSLVWLIISMAIVIVLIVVVIKWLSQRNRAWGVNASLRSLGGIALGQNSSVQIIDIAGRIYVVGVGDTVTLLDKLEDPEQVKAVKDALDKQQSGWMNNPMDLVIQKLRNKRTNGSVEEPVNEQWQSSSSFQQLLDSQMHSRTERKQQLEDLLNETKTDERLMNDEK